MKPIVVLGMHRSGTSALTGVLNRLGFSAGKHLLPANRFNARGYFEDAHLNRRLDKLLRALDRSWHDERLLPVNWMLSNAAAEAADELKVLLTEEFDLSQPTVIKDPRVCRLLPLLQTVLSSVGVPANYVLSLRSPFAVMRSLAQRDSLPAQRAALLYVAHLLEAELHSRNQARVFIKYDDLLSDWRQTIGRIGFGLGLDSLSVVTNETARAADIDTFLSAELNHFAENEPAPSGVAVDLAVEVFSLLQKPLDREGLRALDDLRGRWLTYLDSLEPWLSEAAHLNLLRKELPTALFNPNPTLTQEASLHARSDIYWSSVEQGYTEARKVSAEWGYGQRIIQRFALPAITEKLSSLRWDITDRPAFCLIDKVWIEDSQNKIAWVWHPGEDLFGPLSGDMHGLGLNESGQLQIMASGFDPHAPLVIPDEILVMITEGWSLCAEWQASIPTQELGRLMQGFSITRNHLLNTEATLASTAAERDALRQQTDQQGQHLAQLDQERQQAREEITKAEAQLALLKDLWRENGSLETL